MRHALAAIAVACLAPACTTPAGGAGAATPPATTVTTAAPGATAAAAAGPAELGKPAPDFTLTDLDGKTHRLSDHRGKTVVLEWFNPGCPFVKKSHADGSLKEMARKQ